MAHHDTIDKLTPADELAGALVQVAILAAIAAVTFSPRFWVVYQLALGALVLQGGYLLWAHHRTHRTARPIPRAAWVLSGIIAALTIFDIWQTWMVMKAGTSYTVMHGATVTRASAASLEGNPMDKLVSDTMTGVLLSRAATAAVFLSVFLWASRFTSPIRVGRHFHAANLSRVAIRAAVVVAVAYAGFAIYAAASLPGTLHWSALAARGQATVSYQTDFGTALSDPNSCASHFEQHIRATYDMNTATGLADAKGAVVQGLRDQVCK
jgi:uncharacterized membrane protein